MILKVITYSRRPRVETTGFGASSLMSALVIESLASSCWYRRRWNESWFFDKIGNIDYTKEDGAMSKSCWTTLELPPWRMLASSRARAVIPSARGSCSSGSPRSGSALVCRSPFSRDAPVAREKENAIDIQFRNIKIVNNNNSEC